MAYSNVKFQRSYPGALQHDTKFQNDQLSSFIEKPETVYNIFISGRSQWNLMKHGI